MLLSSQSVGNSNAHTVSIGTNGSRTVLGSDNLAKCYILGVTGGSRVAIDDIKKREKTQIYEMCCHRRKFAKLKI